MQVPCEPLLPTPELPAVETYDCAVLCHVVEMIETPDMPFRLLRDHPRFVTIRWFNPPEYEFDVVGIRRHLSPDQRELAPRLRRNMSRDYYQHLISKHRMQLLRHVSDDAYCTILEKTR